MRNQLFKTIDATFGQEAGTEIENIVNNFLSLESNWLLTIAGLVFFLFVATTLLSVIKLAIQKIWRIRSKELKFKHHSRARFLEIGLIVFTGALFLFSFLIDSTLQWSLEYLQVSWPGLAISLVRFLSLLFSVIVVSVWFTVLFKILPESNVTWDTASSGGLLTGVLFSTGKFVLGKFLIHARIATIFGASASFALLLLFIFYSSFILYYGAAFTHEYGEVFDNHICANKYAVEYEEKIIDDQLNNPTVN
jgi:membrane protein